MFKKIILITTIISLVFLNGNKKDCIIEEEIFYTQQMINEESRILIENKKEAIKNLKNSKKRIEIEPDFELEDLGEYKITAYCPCEICCGKWAGLNLTASGAKPQSNHTIACNSLPFGTEIMLNDIIYTVEDRGGGLKNKQIDIYFDTHEEAWNYAANSKQYQKIYKIKRNK